MAVFAICLPAFDIVLAIKKTWICYFSDIPMDLPKTTKRLLLNDNQITSIPAFGLFNRLPNLESVDLSRNQISNIEEGAFEGANSIIEM